MDTGLWDAGLPDFGFQESHNNISQVLNGVDWLHDDGPSNSPVLVSNISDKVLCHRLSLGGSVHWTSGRMLQRLGSNKDCLGC